MLCKTVEPTARRRAARVVGQCFDRHKDKLKWEVEIPGNNPGTVLESWHDSTSLTPVADEKHIVFHNLNGMLMCCGHNGRILWKRALDLSANMYVLGIGTNGRFIKI